MGAKCQRFLDEVSKIFIYSLGVFGSFESCHVAKCASPAASEDSFSDDVQLQHASELSVQLLS